MTPEKQAQIEELAAKVHTHQRLVDALGAANVIGLGPEESQKSFQKYAVAQAVLFELQEELKAAQQLLSPRMKDTEMLAEAVDLLEHCRGCDLIYSAYDNGIGLGTVWHGVTITRATNIADVVDAFVARHQATLSNRA